MITIGINENVFLSKAEINDKGTLIVSFSDEAQKIGFFEKMKGPGVTDSASDYREFFWPINVPKDKSTPGKPPMTRDQKIEMIQGDIGRRRDQLVHILMQYMTSDKAALNNWADDTGMTDAEGNLIVEADVARDMLMDQAVLDKISKNLFLTFLEKIAPFVGDSSKRFRLKVQRNDPNKAFGSLPDRFLSSRPFMEPMEIPKDASKVYFDDYEIKKGLNDPTPPSRSGADKPAAEGEQQGGATPTVSSVFGTR